LIKTKIVVKYLKHKIGEVYIAFGEAQDFYGEANF